MDINTIEVIERGMKCLSDNLGADETEVFISTILRERFDYTKWQRQLFPDLSVEELNRKAAEYDRTNRSRSAS